MSEPIHLTNPSSDQTATALVTISPTGDHAIIHNTGAVTVLVDGSQILPGERATVPLAR